MKSLAILPALCSATLALCSAVTVHLSPSPALSQAQLDDEWSPRAELSKFMGLDAFETLPEKAKGIFMQQDAFIGVDAPVGTVAGASVLVLSGDADIVDQLLPSTISRQTFSLPLPSDLTPTGLLSLYVQRAAEVYSTVHTGTPSSASLPYNSFTTWTVSSFSEADKSKLAALLSANPAARLVVLATPPAHANRRAESTGLQQSQAPFPSPPAHAPISGISGCFTSAKDCADGTDSCSGHGECALAQKGSQSCYVCSCGTTVEPAASGLSGNKTTRWAGQACERKDYSGDFVLLAGITIVLLLFVTASVTLLSSVGAVELPSVLRAGGVKGKAD
ncbi:hypothetical protein DL96DRAFT_1631627 [Flagelloscypha sp. PMI_526]|nr:hypothetical protein DL96DRAFT_1631627 [Flagelloscypha sp. PMI_526]